MGSFGWWIRRGWIPIVMLEPYPQNSVRTHSNMNFLDHKLQLSSPLGSQNQSMYFINPQLLHIENWSEHYTIHLAITSGMLWYPNFCQKKLRNSFAAIAVALVLTPKIDNYMQLHSYHGPPPDSSMTSGLGLSARLISVLLELSDNRLDEHQQHVQIQHHR